MPFQMGEERDLAAAAIICTEKGRRGEGYILSNEMVSMRQMFDLISEASGAPQVETILAPEQLQAMSHNSFVEEEGRPIWRR